MVIIMALAGCSTLSITISRSQRHNLSFASHPQLLLSASCLLLLLLSIHVGAVPRVAAAISFGESLLDQSLSTGRRLLDRTTQSVVEDGEALLKIKAAITADPKNITFWWKPQGRRRVLNPCKMRNGTTQYWPGINCTNKRVTTIDLSNMSLQGTLSPVLGNLAHLEHLNLSNNHFTGPIPLELGSATALETLDLGNNRLDGEVPSTLGELRNLTNFEVGNNRLGGAIPASVGNLQLLKTLNLSRNNFTDAIPRELNSCRILTVVDLSGNDLGLQVPFQNLENLTVLRLQNNRFIGDFVVSSLGTFPRLQDVDLSNNNLDGIIPTTIGNLPLTSQLSLGHNKLTGNIPNNLNELSLVQRIDLSANQLTGSLPNGVSGLISLREFDISDNQLTGPLPTNLMFLNSLRVFNASHNHFNGSLPGLAQISTLETFDASYNNLTGAVPKNFVNFSTLNSLNVSYNELSGAVPAFVAHDDVNGDSFLFNLALCGANVGLNCVGGSKTKIVSISVGCSVAFAAIILAGLFLCRRRRSNGAKGRSSATVSAEFEMQLNSEDILRITQNFGSQVGVGSMSTVYRGILPDATVVAVKRFGIRRGEMEDAAEKVLSDGFETLGVVRHWAVVRVIAYCCTPEIKAVVTEYLPNGTLNSLLHPPLDADVVREFNWHHRFNTAIVVAEALKYLHHECQPPTVHGDLKTSNVLFTTFMEARVADFGVARVLASHGLGVGASSGYVAPEGRRTIKSDVYSFGIIVLEMISGRSPQSMEQGQQLPEWIRTTISNSKSLQGVVDPILIGELRTQQQRMAMVLGVALLCTREDPDKRPYVTEVLKMLNHIKTRPQDRSRGRSSTSRRLRTSLSTHQRNEEIRQEVPGIEIAPSPPPSPSALPANPSLSHWTPRAENR